MIKNIVIVDDTDFKRESIKNYMQEIFSDEAEVYEFDYINSALRFVAYEHKDAIKKNPNEWLIITDMVMPQLQDTRLLPNGGMIVLSELDRKDFKCPVIIASSMKLSLDDCRDEYEYVLGTVEESPMIYNLSRYEDLLKDYID